MKPIEVGAEVEIKDIHFASNSSLFDKESMFVLNSFVEFLNDNPRVKIEIQGHTDNIGNPKDNMELSKERAKAVRDYLILMGIDSSRIVAYKGFGQTKPIASNNTIEGRAKNRRTEFVIVSK
jgi:outer membrane protein OmpA-like peptidoglycan-associated protein